MNSYGTDKVISGPIRIKSAGALFGYCHRETRHYWLVCYNMGHFSENYLQTNKFLMNDSWNYKCTFYLWPEILFIRTSIQKALFCFVFFKLIRNLIIQKFISLLKLYYHPVIVDYKWKIAQCINDMKINILLI